MTGGQSDSQLTGMRAMLKKHSTEEEYRKRLISIWGKYLETIFTYHKYVKKHEGGRDGQ